MLFVVSRAEAKVSIGKQATRCKILILACEVNPTAPGPGDAGRRSVQGLEAGLAQDGQPVLLDC